MHSVCSRRYPAGPLTTPTATRWDLELGQRFRVRWLARVRYQERQGRSELVVDPVITGIDAGLLELRSTGVSHARSVEATLAYRGPGAGQEIYVSYVRSAAASNVNALDAIQGASRMPLILPDQLAPVRADVPNRLLSWGIVHFPSRITVAPFVEVRTGFPFSPIHDDWNYAAPPGSGRLPWFGSLDLYVNKVFTIAHRLPDARMGLKLYNVASVHAERTIQADVDRADFGRTYDPIPRDFTMVFELLWGHK